MAAEDRRCCGDPFTVAPRLRRRSRTSVRSVGAGREARSGAITRQGSARQPFWAAWPPSARPAVSVGPLFTPCSSNPAPREPFFSESMLVQARTALLDPGARDEFQQVPGVAQAMPWIPGTGNRPAVPLDPLAGTHSAAEQNAEQNAEQPVGHALDMRSGTLVLKYRSHIQEPSRFSKTRELSQRENKCEHTHKSRHIYLYLHGPPAAERSITHVSHTYLTRKLCIYPSSPPRFSRAVLSMRAA